MTGNVLIYANKVARRSETFIYYPALAMQRYVPHFVGSRYADGLPIPAEHTTIANPRGRAGQVIQALKLRLLGHNGVPDLAGRLRHLHPRLIQAHFGLEAYSPLLLARRLDIPLIVYYHGYDATATLETLRGHRFTRRYLQVLPQIQREAALVLTQSDFLRERVIDLGFPADKVQTQYIGVETDERPPLPHSQRQKAVLFAARLVEKKGASDLVAAMAQVQAQYPDLMLWIAGDGSLREQITAQIEASGVRARFFGWQTPQQLRELMRSALIFSVPSVTARNGDAEGFGMVFIEAQREGTPVVSTRHGGIVESVQDGITGLLAPERDPDTLARHIIRLYEDAGLWQRFSRDGAARVRRDFDLHQRVSQLEARYDALLSS